MKAFHEFSATPDPVKPSVLPQRETHFSWLRTRLSTERTLMSWVRTSTAMIGFGFTIFQFFENIREVPGVKAPIFPGAARIVSISLVGIGTLALIVAIQEYRNMVAYLWSDDFKDIAGMKDGPGTTPALAVAVLLTLVGVVTLSSLLFRMLH